MMQQNEAVHTSLTLIEIEMKEGKLIKAYRDTKAWVHVCVCVCTLTLHVSEFRSFVMHLHVVNECVSVPACAAFCV